MSYKQIFRRVNRIVTSAVNDVIEKLTREEQELSDFDEELKKTAGGDAQSSARPAGPGASRAGQREPGGGGSHGKSQPGSRDTGGKGQSQQGARNSGGKERSQPQGGRKPGEKDDAYYYAVLGLTPRASEDEIKRAYRRIMRQVHPDKVATLSSALQKEATEKAMRVSEAYHIIERRRGFK
jgi:DnaJ-domain-containing protein 1